MNQGDDIREEIRDRIRLEALIGNYVALRPSGRRFKGLCPFHAEKTPSFNVDPERQMWRCFGCGVGGDVFDFVEKIENLTFPEAVERLARQLGIPYQRRGEAKERVSEREQLFEVNALAARFYQEQLAAASEASAYLRQRGLEPETIAAFGLGYAPATWEALLGWLTRQKADLAVARKAGLIRDGERGPRDYFVDRVIFPIRDINGRLVGFGARALRAEAAPKYLNSPETPIFNKGRIWYGLDVARTAIAAEGQAVAVEGYLDVIALHQADITTAVAALGTAITPQHAEVIRRYASRLVIAYDGDSAGIAAALRNAAMFEEADCAVRVAELPPGEDPDTLVRGRGAVAVRALLDAAEPLLEYRLKRIRERYNLKDPEARLTMVREAAQAIAQSRSHLVRQEYAGRLNALIGTLFAEAGVEQGQNEQAALLGEVKRIALGAAAARLRGQLGREAPPNGPAAGAGPATRIGPIRPIGPNGQTDTEAPVAGRAPDGQRLAEECVLRAALTDPRWRAELAARLKPDQFTDPDCSRVAAALLGNNNDCSAPVEQIVRDPELTEAISRLLIVEDSAVSEREFGECLAYIERHDQKRQKERLEEEQIATGTRDRNDKRFQEWERLASRLHGAERQPAKGEG